MVKKAHYAIAIGASAGGLEPLQDIIESLPDDLLDSAFVIAQHLSPSYKSVLSELIAKKTDAKVVTIDDHMELKANEIYVTPPDKHVTIKEGRITYVLNEEIHPKPSVNLLFKSIADEYGDRAVGIVLSGTGSDGAEGIEVIKRAGGITVAQELKTCKYTGMPQSAISTDCVDYILAPATIGKNLSKLLKREKITGNRTVKPQKKGAVDDETGVSRILELLEHKLGVDFSHYKKSTIHRRLQKRMQFKKIQSIDKYLVHVVDDPDELNELFKDILIGVTKFYRDREVFESMQPILTRLVEGRAEDQQIRIWVAGCASGEEVYSLAISLFEIAEKRGIQHLPLQIFATDIDQNALNHARIGFYKDSSFDEMPEDLLTKYFTRHKDGYMVDGQVKKAILFSKHDVTSNPPFLKLDLISCRNLLIYFDLTLQRQVIPIFHYALNNDGYLLLGKSESIANFKNLFSVVDPKHKIFQKKPVEKRFYTFPQLRPKKKVTSSVPQSSAKKNLTIAEMVKETVYNTFEYPYVVIDENLDMLEVHKEVSRYLKFKPGSVSTNIMKVIVGDLQLEMRALAGQAIKNNQTVRGGVRRFRPGKGLPHEYIRLIIKPLLFASPIMPYYLVIFEEISLEPDLVADFNIGLQRDDSEDPRFLQLEQELEATKEHMNTLVEELETSNEELQSTNEELQSSNEELQASNEELETSNEELQSTNEELEIAYTELRKATEQIESQKDELERSGNRLKALFNSTVQGHILIESNYNIIMYNERAETNFRELFKKHLEVGKSYVDYMPSDLFRDFQHRFQKALAGEESKDIIQYESDRYFIYHYIPIDKQKNLDTKSVLISFHEITAEKRAEHRLKQANKQLKAQKNLWHRLFVDAPHFIAILSGEKFQYEYVNPNFKKLLNQDEIIGTPIGKSIPVLDKLGLIDILKQVRKTREPYHGNEIELPVDGSGKKYFNITFSPLNSGSGTSDVVLYATDVSDMVEAREVINKSHELIKLENQKLHALFDHAPLYIAVLSGKDHVLDYVNPFVKQLFADKQEIIGRKAVDIIPEISEQGFLGLMDQVYKSGETFIGNEVQADFSNDGQRSKEGRYFNFVFHARRSPEKQTEGITFIGYEVTDQVLARKAIQEKADYLSMLSELMPQKVFTCTAEGKNDYNNSRMIEFSGLTNESLCNDGWQHIIHPEDHDLTSELWEEALKNKRSFQVKHRMKSVDGKYIWHLTRCVPVFSQDGHISQWIGTSTDVHEQVTSEMRKDEFLNVASHELKTPLTTIVAYTELLKGLPTIRQDEVASTYVEKNLKNQLRLNKLIADLLDVTKIQSGKLCLSFRDVDFHTLTTQCLENIAPAYASHQIAFEGEVHHKVRVDESRIEQVFANLISNAVKYSPKADKVVITIKEEDGMAVASVTDFGLGIPVSKQSYIFNRFYRVDENHSTISGLGIGLYISSQIIAAHSGKIWLESNLDEGSTFYFSLPIIDD